jgi:hypothetical protein
MRWAFAGLLATGGLIIALSLGWSSLGWSDLGGSGRHSAPGSATGESAWRLRELIFLKAAYDRTRQDMTRQTEGGASLRAEQERIVRQMAETAKLLPVEVVPAELRALLPNAKAAPAPLSRLTESPPPELPPPELPPRESPPRESPPRESPRRETATAEGRAPDLRVGWRVVSRGEPRPVAHAAEPVAHAAEFAIDPELREPVRHEPAAEQRKRSPRRKPRDDSGPSER